MCRSRSASAHRRPFDALGVAGVALLMLACDRRPAEAPRATVALARPEVMTRASAAPSASAAAARDAWLAAPRAALAANVGCADTCCLDASLLALDAERSPLETQALLFALNHDANTASRTLAARMLRSTHDLAVLAALDPCLDSATRGVPLPEIYVGQAFSPCPSGSGRQRDTVVWERRSLAEVCLETANIITGRFLSRDEYRAWRARYPDPRDSPELWNALVERRVPVEDWVLRELEARSPELFGRVLLTHARGLDGLSLSPADVAARARLTPERVVTALLGPEPWPELAAANARATFLRNVSLGWRELLGSDAGPATLERLWDSVVVMDPPSARAWLALAVADAVPTRRSAALREGLALASGDDEVTARLLESLAATDAVTESARLAAWFTRPPADVPEYVREANQAAILRGLARPGAPRPASLPAILRSVSSGSAPVLEAAAAVARSQGCPLSATDCAGLTPRWLKGGPPPGEPARAEAARRRCRERLVACAARLGR